MLPHRHTSCEIYWKSPTSTIKCFWKSVNIICQRSWSAAGMKDQNACEWDDWPLATSAMVFRSQEFSLSTLVCMSAMMPLHHIYTTVLQGKSQERLFRKSTHNLGSISLHITWEQSVNIQGRGRECVWGRSLTLILVIFRVIQLHSVNRKGCLDGYPRCC